MTCVVTCHTDCQGHWYCLTLALTHCPLTGTVTVHWQTLTDTVTDSLSLTLTVSDSASVTGWHTQTVTVLSLRAVWLQDDLPQKSTTYRLKAPIACATSLRVPPFCIATVQNCHNYTAAKWRHTQAWTLVNEKTHPPIKILTVKKSPRALSMM